MPHRTAMALLSGTWTLLCSALCSALQGPQLPPRTAWPTSLVSHVTRGIRVTVGEEFDSGGSRAGYSAIRKLALQVVQELVVFPLKMIPFAVRTARYRTTNMMPIESPNL